MRRILFALLSTALAEPVAAQDALGTIEGTRDGQAIVWHLTAQDGTSQSGFTNMMRGLDDVSLWGHAEPDSTTSVQGALLLDFNLMSNGGTLTATDATLQYLSEGYKAGYLALNGASLNLTIATAEKRGDALYIQGSFTATPAFSDNIMAMKTDPGQTLTLTGNFSATLPPQ